MPNKLSKRQLASLAVILILTVSIPLIIYLVQRQQIFKSRAVSNPALTFVDNSNDPLPGDPPETQTTSVKLKLTHTLALTPPPPPPSSTGSTLAASPATVSPGGNVTVSWSGVNATDVYWLIRDDRNLGTYVYLGTCSTSPASSYSSISNSGSCTIPAPTTSGVYTYRLYHIIPPSDVNIVATSNQITVE